MRKIFISYSHEDVKYKDMLVEQLEVLKLENFCEYWVDTDIKTGTNWLPQIQKAIEEADIAVLMVSAGFLTSKFIRGKEVPPILERREKEGLRVLPLFVKPCQWKAVPWLSEIQGYPSDETVISLKKKALQEKIFSDFAGIINTLLKDSVSTSTASTTSAASTASTLSTGSTGSTGSTWSTSPQSPQNKKGDSQETPQIQPKEPKPEPSENQNQTQDNNNINKSFSCTGPSPMAFQKGAKSFTPVTFVGRRKELEQIEGYIKTGAAEGKGGVQVFTGRMFHIDGAGGVGKTTLALEAARRYKDLFPDGVISPIRVDDYSPMSFAMHLANDLNIKIDEPADPESAQLIVTRLLAERRSLLILDNAWDWNRLKYMLPLQTQSTLIVTTRNREIYQRMRQMYYTEGLPVHHVGLETFTQEEALRLFGAMLGEGYNETEKDRYLGIAGKLGFLPIALKQAIALMVYAPRYTAGQLLGKLDKEDGLKLLRKGAEVEHEDRRIIETVFDLSSPLLTPEMIETLEYLAVCSAGFVPLDFMEQLTRDPDVSEKLEQLYTYSWCDRREMESNDERWYAVHQLVREVVRGRFGLRKSEAFISTVHRLFTDETVHFSIKDKYFPQLEEALKQGKERKDRRLMDWMYDLYYFCVYRGYGDFYIRLTQVVEEVFPGDKRELGTAYAHRALIYQNFGKLEEAMALQKKNEKIKEELGDRAGLARTYGNQALILKAWGRLDEAMALHRKEEKICEELGDRAGLAVCYGNQANIHYSQGSLDQAMALHRKEEKICEELGDRAGLAISYWNQGNIYAKQNDTKTQLSLWEKSIEINKSMGIPTEEYEKKLAEVRRKGDL